MAWSGCAEGDSSSTLSRTVADATTTRPNEASEMSTDSTISADVLAAVLDATDTALALTDPRGRVRWIKQPMAELLDLTAQQATPPTDPGPAGLIIPRATGEGEHRWLEARCTALPADRLLYRVADVSRWHEQSIDPKI